jgi:hypothetical protein
MESVVLLEDQSPHGNVTAVVEQDDRVTHFYLFGEQGTDFGVRSCWVRNLKPAPADPRQLKTDMEAGIAPMLPRDACSHPSGAPPLDPAMLRVVWLEEGDGAALFEGEELLAVILGWSRDRKLVSYARDCRELTPLASPLSAAPALRDRVRAAEGWWAAWDGPSQPWQELREALLTAYAPLGGSVRYFAADQNRWPPKALIRVDQPDGGVVLATVGMSLRPQPMSVLASHQPANQRRIELAFRLSPEAAVQPAIAALSGYLGAQMEFPWRFCTWLGDGHTLPCDELRHSGGPELSSLLLTAFAPGGPPIQMPVFRNDPVSLLWCIPITDSERQLAVAHGSASLAARLWAAGCTWSQRPRACITHSGSASR